VGDASANGRIVITIDPGRAFGTGHHGSTIGCLEALESVIERDSPSGMIDLGTARASSRSRPRGSVCAPFWRWTTTRRGRRRSGQRRP